MGYEFFCRIFQLLFFLPRRIWRSGFYPHSAVSHQGFSTLFRSPFSKGQPYTVKIRSPLPWYLRIHQCIPSQNQDWYTHSNDVLYCVFLHGTPGLSQIHGQIRQPSSVYKTVGSALKQPVCGNSPYGTYLHHPQRLLLRSLACGSR